MPKKKVSKPSKHEDIPFLETPRRKKTPKKSATIKRPTDLSSIRRLGSRLGKKMPFGNSKPKKKKTGHTQLKSVSPSFIATTVEEIWTMPSQVRSMSANTPKSYKTIPPSFSQGYQQVSVGTTPKTPVLKSAYKKSKFYLALVALLVLAWVGARDYLDNWVATGAFVVSLWFVVETITKRK